MSAFKLIPSDLNIRFMSKRVLFFAFSAFLILASFGLVATKGLQFGIDFKGGILIEVRMPTAANISAMRADLNGLGLGDVELQEFGEASDVLIRLPRQEGEEKAQQAAVDKVKAKLGDGVEYRRTEFVGPKVSAELLEDGILAVAFAILAILVYIWFRFEWQFGLGAVIALVHDVISTIGVFSLIQHEFNLATVAAVLTIAGYSINDTVVIYDRVRENLRKYKKMPLEEVLDISINRTLSRTLMTSFTTLLALVALYFLGAEVIKDFSFAMIWGVLVGTYSSICVAVPLLMYVKLKRPGATAENEPAEEGAA